MTVGKRNRPVGRPRKSLKKKAPDSRPSTSMDTTKVKQRMHRMYSVGQKDGVAHYARHHGVHAAAQHYGVAHKNGLSSM